jgi:acyl-CoA thioester hydrolase
MQHVTSVDDFRRHFPLTFEHEVEFREIDLLHHVNNVRYGEWAEWMRSLYFEDVMRISFFEEQAVIIARHDMHYDAPVGYRDRVLVGGRVSRIGTKSFDFITWVWSLTASRIVFRSTATLVAYDYAANRSIAVPAIWRERIGPIAEG